LEAKEATMPMTTRKSTKKAPQQRGMKNTLRTSTITRQELQDVLIDPGYSADRHKERLKEVLTEQEMTETSGETSDFIAEVKAVIRSLQPEKPISDDVVKIAKRR